MTHEELMRQRDVLVRKYWEETEEPTTVEQIIKLSLESLEREEALVREYRRTHDPRDETMTPEILAEREIDKQLFFKRCALERQLGKTP